MKKICSAIMAVVIMGLTLAGCGKAGSTITVISREEGSGTRSAFIELVGVEEKDADGNKVDKTTESALIQSSTDVVLTQVASDKNAIGYISLGSLNDTVKALQIDGVDATPENVKDGKYTVVRPFNIAVDGEPTGVVADFINFILSDDGQKVVEDSEYITVSSGSFSTDNSEGKIVVSGSSSVTPVMEKLAEAYKGINTKAVIEVQQTDSSSGMKAVLEGTCDIGMASRELKDDETKLKAIEIAKDGIAIVINKDNAINSLTKAQVKDIYTGAVTDWSGIQ